VAQFFNTSFRDIGENDSYYLKRKTRSTAVDFFRLGLVHVRRVGRPAVLVLERGKRKSPRCRLETAQAMARAGFASSIVEVRAASKY